MVPLKGMSQELNHGAQDSIAPGMHNRQWSYPPRTDVGVSLIRGSNVVKSRGLEYWDFESVLGVTERDSGTK